jgi:hypothetical protein
LQFTVAKAVSPMSYWDLDTRTVIQHQLEIDTSLNGRMLVVRHACQDFCSDSNHPAWVQPGDEDPSKPWLAFRLKGRMAQFEKHFPSREAAEMWLQHRYAG